VLDSNVQSALESFSPEGVIVFSHTTPALEHLAQGDVLVSDATPAAPYGLLRKVQSIQKTGEGKVIVETVDAELIEAA
jgi:hypothetical protein